MRYNEAPLPQMPLLQPSPELVYGSVARGVAATYLCFFLSLYSQVGGLGGDQGITPVRELLSRIRSSTSTRGATAGRLTRWRLFPTLCWLVGGSGRTLRRCCGAGAVAALAALLLEGTAAQLGLVACWSLALSLCTALADFCFFPWDLLLLEAGFLALFLPPLGGGTSGGSDGVGEGAPLPGSNRLFFFSMPAVTTVEPPGWVESGCFQLLFFRLMSGFGRTKFEKGWWSGWCAGWRAEWGGGGGGGGGGGSNRGRLPATGGGGRNLDYIKTFMVNMPLPSFLGCCLHQAPRVVHRLGLFLLYIVEVPMPLLAVVGVARPLIAAVSLAQLAMIQITGNFGHFPLIAGVLCLSLLDPRPGYTAVFEPVTHVASGAAASAVVAMLRGALPHHWSAYLLIEGVGTGTNGGDGGGDHSGGGHGGHGGHGGYGGGVSGYQPATNGLGAPSEWANTKAAAASPHVFLTTVILTIATVCRAALLCLHLLGAAASFPFNSWTSSVWPFHAGVFRQVSSRSAAAAAAVGEWLQQKGLLRVHARAGGMRGAGGCPTTCYLQTACVALLRVLRDAAPFHMFHAYGIFPVESPPSVRKMSRVEGSADGVRWRPFVFRYQTPGWSSADVLDEQRRDQEPHMGAPPSWRMVAPHTPRLDMSIFYASVGIQLPSAFSFANPFLVVPGETFLDRLALRLAEGSRPVAGLFKACPSVEQRRFVRIVSYFVTLDRGPEESWIRAMFRTPRWKLLRLPGASATPYLVIVAPVQRPAAARSLRVRSMEPHSPALKTNLASRSTFHWQMLPVWSELLGHPLVEQAKATSVTHRDAVMGTTGGHRVWDLAVEVVGRGAFLSFWQDYIALFQRGQSDASIRGGVSLTDRRAHHKTANVLAFAMLLRLQSSPGWLRGFRWWDCRGGCAVAGCYDNNSDDDDDDQQQLQEYTFAQIGDAVFGLMFRGEATFRAALTHPRDAVKWILRASASSPGALRTAHTRLVGLTRRSSAGIVHHVTCTGIGLTTEHRGYATTPGDHRMVFWHDLDVAMRGGHGAAAGAGGAKEGTEGEEDDGDGDEEVEDGEGGGDQYSDDDDDEDGSGNGGGDSSKMPLYDWFITFVGFTESVAEQFAATFSEENMQLLCHLRTLCPDEEELCECYGMCLDDAVLVVRALRRSRRVVGATNGRRDANLVDGGGGGGKGKGGGAGRGEYGSEGGCGGDNDDDVLDDPGVDDDVDSAAAPPPSLATDDGATAAHAWHTERRRDILRRFPKVRDLLGRGDPGLCCFAAVLVLQPLWVLLCERMAPWQVILFGAAVGARCMAGSMSVAHALAHGTLSKRAALRPGSTWSCALMQVVFSCNPHYIDGYVYSRFYHLSHHARVGRDGVKDVQVAEILGRTALDGDVWFISRHDAYKMRHGGHATKKGAGVGAGAGAKVGAEADNTPVLGSAGHWRGRGETVLALLFLVLVGWSHSTVSFLALPLRTAVIVRRGARYVSGLRPEEPLVGHVERDTMMLAILQLSVLAALIAAGASTGCLLYFYAAHVARTSPLYPAVLWEYPHLSESKKRGGGERGEAARCQPTLSCYVGGSKASKSMMSGGRLIGAARWCFDAFVWWENYHVEHHDFPDIPLSLLPRLRWDLAAPMYDSLVCRSPEDLWGIALGGRGGGGGASYACRTTL